MKEPAAGTPVAFLVSAACVLPARVVSNAEMAAARGVDPEWIRTTSGIESRRYAAADESVVSLGTEAARRCLAAASDAQIGLVLVASSSAPRRWPGPAAEVAQALGLSTVPALDVPLPSAGGVYALALARSLAADYGDVLVVAAEKMSDVVNDAATHPNVAVLFGDGAAACVVSARAGRAVIRDAVLHSDGSFADALRLDVHGPLTMDGRTIIMQANRKLPQVIGELLDRHALTAPQVRMFVLHQANLNLLRQVGKALGASEAQVFTNIQGYGNTSSASALIALAEWGGWSDLAPHDTAVIAAFGAGLQWGAVLLTGVPVAANS